LISLLVVTCWAVACSEDHAHEDPDVEGCEHLQDGPAVAVTAATAAGATPAVADDHQRYDVTLVAATGGMGGFVRFAAAAASDYIFFLNADVPVQFRDAAGAVVPPEDSASSSTVCTDIKGRHLVPLEVGPYDLQLGPTTATMVGIVVEPAAHADH
jgi:hypothetical protein